MTYYMTYYSDELYHHGIKGQRWGRRRFQNEDGSLTSAGRERYGVSVGGAARRAYAKVLTTSAKINRAFGNRSMASSKEQIARRQLKKADAADKASLAKREARDRAFAKKYLGMNDEDYDSAMNAANDAIARRKASRGMTNNGSNPTASIKTKTEDFAKNHGKLVKAAKVAANVATLGATGRIEKSEKKYKEAQKNGAKESVAGLALKGYLRKNAYKGNKVAMQYLRSAAASAAVAAYVASEGNPKVKAGAMAAGKVISAMATANIAVSTAYNVYAQARDTKRYIDQRAEKSRKNKKK